MDLIKKLEANLRQGSVSHAKFLWYYFLNACIHIVIQIITKSN